MSDKAGSVRMGIDLRCSFLNRGEYGEKWFVPAGYIFEPMMLHLTAARTQLVLNARSSEHVVKEENSPHVEPPAAGNSRERDGLSIPSPKSRLGEIRELTILA